MRWLDIEENAKDIHRLRQLAQTADAIDSPDAIVFWRRLHVVVPNEHDVLEALAEHALAIDAIDEAMELFGRLSQSDASVEVRRRALLVRADLLVELGNLDEAERSYRRLALVNPHSPLPWLALKDLLIRRFDYIAAGEALAEAIERTTASEQKAALGRELAMMLADEVGDLDGSIRHWERVLELESHDLGALSALWPLYGKQGRVDDMLRILDAHSQAASHVGVAGQYLIDAAEWLEEECDDVRAALACWARAHRALGDDTQHGCLARIEQLSNRIESFDILIDALVLSGQREQSSQAKGLFFFRASQVHSEKTQDLANAIELGCRALRADPEALIIRDRLLEYAHGLSADAGWIQLAETFEHLATAAGDPGEYYLLAGDAMSRAAERELDAFELYAEAFSASGGDAGADALFRLAEQYDWWPELDELIGRTLHSLDPSVAAARLAVLGGLYEQVGARHRAAFERYLQGFRLDQSSDELRDDIWRLAEFLDAWPEVVSLFDHLVDHSNDPERRSQFLLKRAQVEINRLVDRERGIETLKRAISSAPEQDELHVFLAQCIEHPEDYLRIAQFYEEEGAWSQAIQNRVALFRRASLAYRTGGDTQSAARLLTMISEVSPDDQALFDERVELLEQAGDWTQLTEVLQRQSERASLDERNPILRRLAQIYETKLGDTDGAMQTWEQILEHEPGDDAVFDALSAALLKAEAWERLDRVIALRLPTVDESELPDLLEKRAVILDQHLGQTARAIPILFELVQCAPARFDMIQRLDGLITRREDAIRLIGFIDDVLETSPELDESGQLSLLLGRLAQTKADRPQRALDAYRRVIQSNPDDLALAREVGALMIQQRKHEDLLQHYLDYGPSYFDNDLDARGAYSQIAEVNWLEAMSIVQEERLLDVDGAVTNLEALVALDPGHYSALERLRRLIFRLRDVPRMLGVIDSVAQHVEATQAVIFLVEGARAIQSTGTIENAIPLWRQVLEFAPGHEEAQGICMRHARRNDDLDAIAEVFQARIRSARSPEDQAARLTECAEFEESQRRDVRTAIGLLRKAVAADPGYGLGLARLARLAIEADDEDLIRELSPILLRQFDIGFSDQDLSEVAPYLAEVQVYLASCVSSGEAETPMDYLLDGYQRTPHERSIAQAYADALFESGDCIGAGNIYQDIAMPTFEPGPDGDIQRAQEHLRRAQAFHAIDLDVRAIHHFETAARHPETRMVSLSALATIQEAAGRWEAVVRFKEKLADCLEVGHRGATFAELADILDQKLGRTQRAVTMYSKALADGFADAVSLLRMLDFFEEAGRYDQALATIERLLERQFGPAALARLFLRKAQLHQKNGAFEAGLDLVFEALSLQPDDPTVFETLVDSLGRMEGEQSAVAIDRALDFIQRVSSGVSADVKCRWANWLLSVHRHQQARGIYEEVLHIGARTFEVLDGLARIEANALSLDSGPTARLAYRLESLRVNPGHINALSHLSQLFTELGYPNARDPSGGLLSLFGQSARTPQDDAKNSEYFGHVLTSDGNLIEQLVEPMEAHPMSLLFDGLLMVVGDAYDEVYQRDVLKTDVALSDHVLDRPNIVKAIGTAMSWSDVALCELPLSHAEPCLLSLAKPIVGVSPSFSTAMTDGDQIYRLARATYLARGWRAFAESIPDAHTRGLLGGLCALTHPDWGPEFALELGGDEEQIAHWAEFLLVLCPADMLAEFAPFVQEVASMGADELDRWKASMKSTADKVAFVLSGDFAAALRDGKQRVADAKDIVVSGPTGFVELIETVPSLKALHDFAFSLDYCGLFLDEEATLAGGL
ncbi:MAG: hypothetical protein VX589_07535 [Myxococcota bacterium]|nr:hypothetical protein [Myxococcota bacterium]